VVRVTYENGVEVSREVIGYRPLPSAGRGLARPPGPVGSQGLEE